MLERLNRSVSAAPLALFRVLFGALMLFSTLRFWSMGWIEKHYIQPIFHFRYFGFEWVPIGPDWFIYAIHILLIFSSLGIMLGAFYRISALAFFLSFTYTELIDLTYYLNHYYFVSLVGFILIFLPAHRHFSIDALRKPELSADYVPFWTIGLLKFQIFVVYFFAGIAKINYDWLIQALPMRIWLPAHDNFPIVGSLLALPETAFVFSWLGMLFDISIVFFLVWRHSRLLAYVSVIVFHTMTGLMFQIGVFPLVMIGVTTIFFDASWHKKALSGIQPLISWISFPTTSSDGFVQKSPFLGNLGLGFILLFVGFQLLFPLRFLAYPGNLYWTEQGYRFSWRVMLVEKSGSATFYVKDGETGREGVVDNSEFLNRHQEKQMSFQPDMIVQFAHFLAKHYANEGVANPLVRVEAWVTLNARPSQLMIDPSLDLTTISDGWQHRSWILEPSNEWRESTITTTEDSVCE